MNELITGMESTGRSCTVRELAYVLDVGESTVKRAVEKLRSVLGEVLMNNQGGYLFSEEQATLIKKEIQGHHNLASRQIDAVSTELEENEMIAQAWSIIQRRQVELEEKLRIEKERADRFESTNKLLMHSMKLYTVTEIAKELGYPSAIELNKILEEKGIQYKVNGTWVPSAKFSGCGYFEIKQEVHDNGFVYYDRKVTQEGREFILKLLA